MALPTLCDALPRALSSSSSETSDTSVSPPGSTSSWHDFVAAQYDVAARTVATSHSSKPSVPSRASRPVLLSPGLRRARRQYGQTGKNSAPYTSNDHSKFHGTAHQSPRSGGLPHRPLDSRTHNLEWRTWNEVQVKIFDLPPNTFTRDLAIWFRDEGIICSIEMFQNRATSNNGSAKITFR